MADPGILIQKVNVASWQKISQGNNIGAISVCVCGGGGASCSPNPSPQSESLQNTDFVDTMKSKGLLPKSADD